MLAERTDDKFRYELKYVCSDLQLIELEQRIVPLLRKDPHINKNGYYSIRSLYFDDYYDSCYHEKENGTDPRKKFRIRVYDGNINHMSLEIKHKQKDKTKKEKTRITQEQYQYLISDTTQLYPLRDQPILNQLLLLKAEKLMKPSIIVEYDRVPYIAEEGNVRITFDRNIRSSKMVEDFIHKDIFMRAVMPSGQHLLEVKFDEFLPDYIYRILNLESMIKTSFSKYYLCRKFY